MIKELYTTTKPRYVLLIDETKKIFDFFAAFGGVEYSKYRKKITRKGMFKIIEELKKDGYKKEYIYNINLYYNNN